MCAAPSISPLETHDICRHAQLLRLDIQTVVTLIYRTARAI